MAETSFLMWQVLEKVPSGSRLAFCTTIHASTHIHTQHSAEHWDICIFYSHFCTEKVWPPNQMSNHVNFFRRGRVIFLWGGKCRDISAPYAKGDLPSCHALTRGTKFSHCSKPPCPAKCCHLSMCMHCIFLIAWHRPPARTRMSLSWRSGPLWYIVSSFVLKRIIIK